MERRKFLEKLPIAGAALSVPLIAQSQSSAPRASTSGGTPAAAVAEQVSVLDFIPAELHEGIRSGTGTVDLTGYIQSAINSRHGVALAVHFPTGTYCVDGTLLIRRSHILLAGDNAGILHRNTTSDAISLGDGTTPQYRIEIRGFLFTKATAASAGAIISSKYCSIVSVRDCYFYGDEKIFNVMAFERGLQINIQNNISEKCRGVHVSLRGLGKDNDRVVDATIYDNRFDYGTSALIATGYVEGIFFRRNICLRQHNIIVSLNGIPGWIIPSVKLQENDFDGGDSIGLQMEHVSNVQVVGNWFSSLKDTGLRIDQNAGGMVVSDNQFYGNAGWTAIEIGGQGLVCSGNYISGGQRGVYLRSTCQNLTFTGNSISYMSGQAISLVENPSIVTIVGNNFFGNGAAISPGGTNLNIANNLSA